MREDINYDRRRWLGSAAMAMAAVPLSVSSQFEPQSSQKQAKANTTFGPHKQIEAGVLNVGYAEAGRPTGQNHSSQTP